MRFNWINGEYKGIAVKYAKVGENRARSICKTCGVYLPKPGYQVKVAVIDGDQSRQCWLTNRGGQFEVSPAL